MAKGKKYVDSEKLFDHDRLHSAAEAVDLARAMVKRSFDETVEIAVRLGVNPKHADQMVRGALVLPHGTGQKVRVLVFAKGDAARAATEAGADYVGAEEYVDKITNENWFEFDVCVATPDMMRLLGKLGRVLGPKGLMPNPKSGTVTNDVGRAVQEIKSGKVEYRVDKTSITHIPIGKASFGAEKLLENYNALLDAVTRAKPSSSKGTYLKSVVVHATMGPGIKIATSTGT